jgi:hypothetical protein
MKTPTPITSPLGEVERATALREKGGLAQPQVEPTRNSNRELNAPIRDRLKPEQGIAAGVVTAIYRFFG